MMSLPAFVALRFMCLVVLSLWSELGKIQGCRRQGSEETVTNAFHSLVSKDIGLGACGLHWLGLSRMYD